jgi:hypothetical protein
MRKALAALAVFVSLGLMVGEAQSAARFTVSRTSNLLKRMGCGVNPENCIWCTELHCYEVLGCNDDKCIISSSLQRESNPPKFGPVREGNPPTIVGPPSRKPRPVRPVGPVGVSNPDQPTSGRQPVILLRASSSGGGGGGGGHGHGH